VYKSKNVFDLIFLGEVKWKWKFCEWFTKQAGLYIYIYIDVYFWISRTIIIYIHSN
jgi:hypothetical protein